MDRCRDIVSAQAYTASRTDQESQTASGFEEAVAATLEGSSFATRKTVEDPTLTRLDPANKAPVTVKPDDTVQMATRLMLRHDYSQLPSKFNLEGRFSWKSLGRRLALVHKCQHLRDCLAPPYEIKSRAWLFEAVCPIVEHGGTLVRSAGNKDDWKLSRRLI